MIFFFLDNWSLFRDYSYNHGNDQVYVTGLLLDPGNLYRFVVKLCARDTCFQPFYSDGVLILANPPVTNTIDLQHENTSNSEKVNIAEIVQLVYHQPKMLFLICKLKYICFQFFKMTYDFYWQQVCTIN